MKFTLLAFVATLAACTVPCRPGGATFDPGPWLDDLSVARAAIVAKYAGLAWDVNERGLDVEAAYAAARERVTAAADAGDARKAFERFADKFGDRHVHFQWVRRSASGPGADPASICAKLGYDTRMQAPALAMRMSGVAELTQSSSEFDTGILDVSGKRVGIVQIKLFSPHGFPSLCEAALNALAIRPDAACDDTCADKVDHWTDARYTEDFVAALRAVQKADAQALLIDLAGNGGGSEWVEAAARMVTDRPLEPLRNRFVRGEHWRHKFEATERDLRAAAVAASADGRAILLPLADEVAARKQEASEPCDGEAVIRRQTSCSWTGDGFYSTGLLSSLDPEKRNESWASLLYTPAQYPYHEGLWRGPLIVVVDGNTGSAAEGFSAELQDGKAATIVGSPTVGAGCGYTDGGTPTILPNSRATLMVSDCVRIRPNGANLASGVQPDVLVGFREADTAVERARLLQAALRSTVADRLR